MLVKSLLPDDTRRGYEIERSEDGDSDVELYGLKRSSEDRLMKLATVTALEVRNGSFLEHRLLRASGNISERMDNFASCKSKVYCPMNRL